MICEDIRLFNGKRPDRIQGAILIDCWHGDRIANHAPWYQHVCDRLVDLQLSVVVNASADLTTNFHPHPWQNWQYDPSIKNTILRYAVDSGNFGGNNPQYRDTWAPGSQQIITNLHRYCYGGKHTDERFFHPKILGNSQSVALFTPEDFLYHWRRGCLEYIQNWLVVGKSWQVCVHDRNLGLRQMTNLTRITGGRLRFYIEPWGIMDEGLRTITAADIENDELIWQPTAIGYRLVDPLDWNQPIYK